MIETLYFHTYFSYLKGNLDETEMFFEMLKDEYKNRRDPKALNLKQIDNLKIIRSSLKSGKFHTHGTEWVLQNNVRVTGRPSPNIYQDELVKKIYFEGFDSMRELLESDVSLKLYNIEHPCGECGAVDMVFKDDRRIYPVEIKRTEGKHDIIGQIMKYTLHFKFQLHYKLFEDVKPVTVCNSYNPQVLQELKKLGVLPIKYTIVEDCIELGAV